MKEILKSFVSARIVIEPKVYGWQNDEKGIMWAIKEIEEAVRDSKTLSYHYVSREVEYEWLCPYCKYSFGDKPPKENEMDCCDDILDALEGKRE